LALDLLSRRIRRRSEAQQAATWQPQLAGSFRWFPVTTTSTPWETSAPASWGACALRYV
jgi:hypothetical protein